MKMTFVRLEQFFETGIFVYRTSNFEVGEILNIARQNVHSELPAFVSKKESK